MFKVWVDADACPGPIRDIVLRACLKRKISAVFVANKMLQLPISQLLVSVQVAHGADVADAYIVDNASPGDLVITQDIPLAAQLVAKGSTVITPRGDLYDTTNINEALASRNLMNELRQTGAIAGGPKPFDEKNKRLFASAFDACLHRLS